MALQRELENISGNTGNYWRVDQITMERLSMKLEARLNLYRSKADRNAGKRSMDNQQIIVMDVPAASTTISGLVAAIYIYAKSNNTSDQQPDETPFFDGATDV